MTTGRINQVAIFSRPAERGGERETLDKAPQCAPRQFPPPCSLAGRSSCLEFLRLGDVNHTNHIVLTRWYVCMDLEEQSFPIAGMRA